MISSPIGLPDSTFSNLCVEESTPQWFGYIREAITSVGLLFRSYGGNSRVSAYSKLIEAERTFTTIHPPKIFHNTLLKARKAFLEGLQGVDSNFIFVQSLEYIEAYLEGLDWCVLDTENLETTLTRLLIKTLNKQDANEGAKRLVAYFASHEIKVLSLRQKIGSLWVDLRKEISQNFSPSFVFSWEMSFTASFLKKREELINLINDSIARAFHILENK